MALVLLAGTIPFAAFRRRAQDDPPVRGGESSIRALSQARPVRLGLQPSQFRSRWLSRRALLLDLEVLILRPRVQSPAGAGDAGPRCNAQLVSIPSSGQSSPASRFGMVVPGPRRPRAYAALGGFAVVVKFGGVEARRWLIRRTTHRAQVDRVPRSLALLPPRFGRRCCFAAVHVAITVRRLAAERTARYLRRSRFPELGVVAGGFAFSPDDAFLAHFAAHRMDRNDWHDSRCAPWPANGFKRSSVSRHGRDADRTTSRPLVRPAVV